MLFDCSISEAECQSIVNQQTFQHLRLDFSPNLKKSLELSELLKTKIKIQIFNGNYEFY